jgi:hypothetical protein
MCCGTIPFCFPEKSPLTNGEVSFIMSCIAMMKRIETGCFQRAGGWCEPVAECFRIYGFGAERSRA